MIKYIPLQPDAEIRSKVDVRYNIIIMIPFVDLKAQYQSIKSEIDKAVNDCISDSNFIRGKAVGEFERAFAKYIGAQYCGGCGNGTDALEMILEALMIGEGDEVIVPALTWISTAEAVNNVGAEPVFVDVDAETYTIDIRKIEEKISGKTKAIIPVHLYGCPAEMDQILEIAGKYKLFVIEDCAQAHGAEYNGRKIGTFGIASAFSFFPSKNLGAFGDAGAVVTNDRELYETVCKISNHGQLKIKHEHSRIGRNSRLDTIQAAVLGAKLTHLDDWNKQRIHAAEYYRSVLSGVKEIILPSVLNNRKHVFHLFVVRLKNRQNLVEMFGKNDIQFGIHYPKPLPFLDAYRYKNHTPGDFPVALRMTEEIISLPIFPEITDHQISEVCKLVKESF